MKKIISVILFCIAFAGYSQEKRDTTTFIYSEVVAVGKYGTTADEPFNVNLYYDFGKGKEISIKDKSGKEVLITTEIDAINYLAESGWSLATSTSVELPNWKWVTRHIMKKAKYK